MLDPLPPDPDLLKTFVPILPFVPISSSSLVGECSEAVSHRSTSDSSAEQTLSFANRSKASVKLLDASSRCTLDPQFCDSAFAS